MIEASIIENSVEDDSYRYFYEVGDFFFMTSVHSEYPFKSPYRHSSVAYKGDFKQGLQYWAKLMAQKKPADTCVFKKVSNKPGSYFPRMWRGQMQNLEPQQLAESQTILSNRWWQEN